MKNIEEHNCQYCGGEGKFQFKNGEWCCSENKSDCPSIKLKISSSLKSFHDSLKSYGYNFKNNPNKKSLIKSQEHVCFFCGGYAEFKLKNGKWCCHKSFNSCPAIIKKNSEKHVEMHKSGRYDEWNRKQKENPNVYSWNKGRTAEDTPSIKRASEKLKQRYESGDLVIWSKGKKISEEIRLKISKSMKLAHAEGRAHNIGESRWNVMPSYPEKWFIEVIENEFYDKKYVREFPFHAFSLDFAWPDKKLCIEIDGEQHQRFDDIIERDKRKDKTIAKYGWKVMRMPWKSVYADTKTWISKAKNFIGK